MGARCRHFPHSGLIHKVFAPPSTDNSSYLSDHLQTLDLRNDGDSKSGCKKHRTVAPFRLFASATPHTMARSSLDIEALGTERLRWPNRAADRQEQQ
jgi:hypothetical protein